jgi:hypothetical protein
VKRASVRWIEAGKILGANPNAKVRCPENNDDFLATQDSSPAENPTHIERHMRCSKCGAYNAVLLRTAAKSK